MATQVQGSMCPDAYLMTTMGDKWAELIFELESNKISVLISKIDNIKEKIAEKEKKVAAVETPNVSLLSSTNFYSAFSAMSSTFSYYLGTEVAEPPNEVSTQEEIESLQWELEGAELEFENAKEDPKLYKKTVDVFHRLLTLEKICDIFGRHFETLPYIKLSDMTPSQSPAIQSTILDNHPVVAGEHSNGGIYIAFKKKVTEPRPGYYLQMIRESQGKWLFIDETNHRSLEDIVPLFEGAELINKEAFEKVKRIVASIYKGNKD